MEDPQRTCTIDGGGQPQKNNIHVLFFYNGGLSEIEILRLCSLNVIKLISYCFLSL